MQVVPEELWAKAKAAAAAVAISAVVITIFITDFATGGADEPKPHNTAKLGPPVSAATPLPVATRAPVAALTPTIAPPTITPTVAPGAVAGPRDTRRKSDIESLKAALLAYYEEEEEYPSTGGNVQTGCNYPDLDALCKIEDFLDPIPGDPLGDPGQNGYWYISDGKTFTVVASMELPENATPQTCPEQVTKTLGKTNLYCAVGGQ